MVGCVARRRDRHKRSDARAVRGERGRVTASRPDLRPRKALPQAGQRLGMIGVIVRERDPAQAAALGGLSGERVKVGFEHGARIYQPGWIAADEPGVRPGQRERARVGRPDPDDVVVRDLDSGHPARMSSPAPTWFVRSCVRDSPGEAGDPPHGPAGGRDLLWRD
jgi:hypothetical protein